LGPVQKQRWTYACAKQLLERLVYAYGMEGQLPFTIVRPFNFIGPRMDYLPTVEGEGVPRVMACFMDALLFNKPLRLVEGGTNRRAFTDIRDATDAVIAMLKNPDNAKGQIFNIGHPGNEVTIRELAEKMVSLYPALSGKPLPPNCRLENVTAKEFYGADYEDSDRRIPDISLAQRLLDWRPKIALDNALENTMKGFIEDRTRVNPPPFPLS
jgi:UDP-apiose/xylose synthase